MCNRSHEVEEQQWSETLLGKTAFEKNLGKMVSLSLQIISVHNSNRAFSSYRTGSQT